MPFKILSKTIPLLALSGLCFATPLTIELQRSTYGDLESHIRDGHRSALAKARKQLADYPLLIDLEASFLRSTLDKPNHATITSFLNNEQNLRPIRRLRYAYATTLVKQREWEKYLSLYNEHYQKQGDINLDCYASRAKIVLGEADAKDTTLSLWLVGKSQPKSCDESFRWLEKNNVLNTSHRKQRYQLAIDAQEFSLAAYLAKPLNRERQLEADAWLRMRSQPGRELKQLFSGRVSEKQQKRALYGIERLARSDADLAFDYWQRLKANDENQEGYQGALRTIVRRSASQGRDDAFERKALLDSASVNDELLTYLARYALKKHDWDTLLKTIAEMSESGQRDPEWQYWRARALGETGNELASKVIYQELARGRGYYSFRSADWLDTAYSLNYLKTETDQISLDEISEMFLVKRARELHALEDYGAARAEWNEAMAELDQNQRAQGALLARQWDWHSRVIQNASWGNIYDDIVLRFPLAYQDLVVAHSEKNQIDASWIYAIAQSESSFMPDVRSSAGALGLMQLMPATGRETARRGKIRYHGTSSLTKPETNVQLGSAYLAQMYNRFEQNPVLATAAYNAGPGNVGRWIPQDGAIESDIWIDTIPFNETRRYVRRVLESQVIFEWRLHGEMRRISSIVKPVGKNTQLAAR